MGQIQTAPDLIGENGTWTPTLSFTTPGDLSVAYTKQVGFYQRTNKGVILTFEVIGTPTYTTASGVFNIGGLPFVNGGGIGTASIPPLIALTWPAGRTQALGLIPASTARIEIYGFASGSVIAAFTQVNVPSGTANLRFTGSATYIRA